MKEYSRQMIHLFRHLSLICDRRSYQYSKDDFKKNALIPINNLYTITSLQVNKEKLLTENLFLFTYSSVF